MIDKNESEENPFVQLAGSMKIETSIEAVGLGIWNRSIFFRQMIRYVKLEMSNNAADDLTSLQVTTNQ